MVAAFNISNDSSLKQKILKLSTQHNFQCNNAKKLTYHILFALDRGNATANLLPMMLPSYHAHPPKI